MIIRRVRLTGFRSHEDFVLECNNRVTVITGVNGCGKTSVIEAIYEALQGKSFRAVDEDIIGRGASFYRVEVEYADGRKVVVAYDGNKKEFLAEDRKTRRLPKKSKYPIVLFEPDDLHLVSASPTTKRSYFDRSFAQLGENYSVALSRYNKALKQRNELLKQIEVRSSDVFPWDVMLAKYGAELAKIRQSEIEQINLKLTDTYRSIAENDDEVMLVYDTAISSESAMIERLSREFERDKILGHTSFGVHRDNYTFRFNGVMADGSASRGEVRSSILALKFIEAEILKERLGRNPLVLLDDVFSELDKARQKCLVKNFHENQVILTSVGEGRMVIS